MSKKFWFFVVVIFVTTWVFILTNYLANVNIPILQPAGEIGQKQLGLIQFALALSLIVVIPVFVMTFMIVWKYRESNKNAQYSPNWDSNKLLEVIWWGIPAALIFIIGSVIRTSTYALDPYKPINSSQKPLHVQVVAMNWKWLFVYPEQGIASVNYLEIPNNTPVKFQITSDGPMNSFWIPQLGGQIYAMPGMETQLSLISDKTGSYRGSSANLSGNGFAGMKFTARSVTNQDFQNWISLTKGTGSNLNLTTYDYLSKPSKNNKVEYYSSVERGIFDHVLMKYMVPAKQMSNNYNHVGHSQ